MFIVPFFIISCGPSEEFLNKKSEQFWEMSTFTPNSYSEINGVYEYSTGFESGYLKLNKDSTFSLRIWNDIYDPTNPYNGIIGKYFIKVDTLILKRNSITIDTNIFKERHPEIKDDEIIKRMIQDSLKVKNEKFNQYLSSLKDTNLTSYIRLQNLNKFYIKRIGEYIFLIRLPFKSLFLDELKNNNGFPDLCETCKDKIFDFYFTKIHR